MAHVAKEAWRAIVIGGSAGSTEVLVRLLSSLSPGFSLPVIICVHLHVSDDGYLVEHLDSCGALETVGASDKLWIKPGIVYLAPANYHLLIERQGSFALSVDERVNCSRPSIDVLFESAAYAFGAGLVGILLSGASHDGASGLQVIQSMGGFTIAQDPQTAKYPRMPQAAVDRRAARKVLSPDEIRSFVTHLSGTMERTH